MPYPTSTITLVCENNDMSVKYFNLDDFSILFDQISTMWGVKILKLIHFIGSYNVKELLSMLYPITDKIKEDSKIESYQNTIKMCRKMINSVIVTIDEYDEFYNNAKVYFQTNQLINYINLFIDLYSYQLELCHKIFVELNDKKLISDDMIRDIENSYELCRFIFNEIFKNVFGEPNYGLSKNNIVFSKQFVLDAIMRKDCPHRSSDFDSHVKFYEIGRLPFNKPEYVSFNNNTHDRNAVRRILKHIKYTYKNKDIDDNVYDIKMSSVFPAPNNDLYKINNLEYNSSGFNNKESMDKYNYYASKYIFALKDYDDEKKKFDEQKDINNKNKKQTDEQNISISEDITSDDFTEASDSETYDYISANPPKNKNDIWKLFKLIRKNKKGLYY